MEFLAYFIGFATIAAFLYFMWLDTKTHKTKH
jgi:Ca2+/H+ antiporter